MPGSLALTCISSCIEMSRPPTDLATHRGTTIIQPAATSKGNTCEGPEGAMTSALASSNTATMVWTVSQGPCFAQATCSAVCPPCVVFT